MRADDVEPCARIVATDPLWRRYGMTLGGARRALRRAAIRGTAAGEIAVARAGRRPLGFVWFRREGTFHHSGYVRWIAVAPDARGRGVGARLMRYAEARIFEVGPNVFLLVSDFNRAAQAFYRKLGYTEVGALRDYVVRGVTERVYRKTRAPIAPVAAGGGRTRARGTSTTRRRRQQ
jgi:ribosomal protein S18 acetylase RimI-like enzyme